MANIPTNSSAQILTAGNSVTGSFAGFLVCPLFVAAPETQVATFTGLKDSNGCDLISGSTLNVLAGVYVPVSIISASLGAASSPILLYR